MKRASSMSSKPMTAICVGTRILLRRNSSSTITAIESLGVVELLMALEDEFGVSIPDEEAENIGTVGQAVDIVIAKMGA